MLRMIVPPLGAPGCFAAATVFSRDSSVCRACACFDQCEQASLLTLERIKGVINVHDLMRRHDRAKRVANAALKEKDEAAKAALPPGNIKKALIGEAPRHTKVLPVTFSVTKNDEDIIATIPTKTQKLAVVFVKKDYMTTIRESIKAGHNKFSASAPPWLVEATTLLIAGGFTRTELRDHLMNKLNWKIGTAQPHVSYLLAILIPFGVVQESEGRIVPVPHTVS